MVTLVQCNGILRKFYGIVIAFNKMVKILEDQSGGKCQFINATYLPLPPPLFRHPQLNQYL